MEIPAELFRPIVGYVRDRPTLRSLLLCCRHLNGEAERSLYYKFEHVHNSISQVLFLQRVVGCPRVAELVCSYRFEIDWRTNFGEDHIFWEILPKALRALVNLKTLQFRTTGGGPIEGLLDGCTFQLEDLHWHCHSDELKIQSFLPTQRGLRRLSLGGWDDTRFSAPSSNAGQPDFRELAGSYGVVHAFLPGREITRLRWVPDLDDPWDTSTGLDIEGLATSLEKLKYLSFGGYFTRPHLCSISDHLSSLFYLELMGYDRQEDESVCSLPSLKWLRISIRWGLSQSSISDPQERTVQMFTCSKSLQTIEVQEEAKFDNHGNKIHSYNRWDRNLGLVRKFDEQTEMWPEVF